MEEGGFVKGKFGNGFDLRPLKEECFCVGGAGVFGHLSDSFLGRKGTLTLVCAINLVSGCLTALAPTYWVYVVLRFLTGFSTGGVGTCSFVLATEPVGPSKRGIAGMSTFYFFSGGIAVLAAIAYVFPSWRALYIASSIPSLLFLVAIIPFLSESPRWYLVRGDISSAMKVMREIANCNGKVLPNNVTLTLEDNSRKCDGPAVQESVSGSIIDVVRSPLTRMRLVLIVAINFLTSIVYYGLSLNVVNLGTNLFLNVALNAIAEMPAFALTAILIDLFGRKPLTIGTMWFSGVFCVLGSILKSAGISKVAQMVCGILGIFGMAGTYNLLFIYVTELFPTVVRNAALGCATQSAQMGAILAPLVVVLGGGVPFAIFGVCGIVGGILSFLLPETFNQPLYDTLAGMEESEHTEHGKEKV
ncbi:organic cation/carnitine transporter 4 [Cinnamomum micranthum f. kanehirae]|uniref:Organic cation/carnitine transporter 4 n=1 Tax=Cinnamomum micranthum f. kanehirae TaxID=337451 RepID=A0A443PJK4_9MAGN|nr:organic cation/carnitine transporter 4 [Cinnamomum micranthum f. kanehirae]